jgi:multidrug efflux system membrane fusion protein
VNPGTGSITVRGVVPNPKPGDGVRLLSPGMFVRVRLPIGQPHDALLVIDRAIGSDQGMKFVYVIDDKNIVQHRRVETAALQEDGLRVIDSGVKAQDWVVVGGIQQVRPKMTIMPDREPMPTLGVTLESSNGNGTSASGSSKTDSREGEKSSKAGNGTSSSDQHRSEDGSDSATNNKSTSNKSEKPTSAHSENASGSPSSKAPNPTKTD